MFLVLACGGSHGAFIDVVVQPRSSAAQVSCPMTIFKKIPQLLSRWITR